MIYNGTFDKDMSKLRKNCPRAFKRLMERVDDLCKNPYQGVRMVGTNLYKDRVGKYRIKYSVNEGACNVHFIKIKKRGGNFYKAG